MRCVLLATVLCVACDSTSLPPSDGGVDAALAADSSPDDAESAVDSSIDAEGRGRLVIVPETHDFGPVPPGSMSDPFSFVVSNAGDGPVRAFGVALDGPDFAPALADRSCALEMLPPRARCTFQIVFKPRSRGGKTALVVATGAEQKATATLNGTGVDGPHLLISPASQMFAVAVGTVSAPVTFTVATTGDPSTAAISSTLAGADPSQFRMTNDCPAPLPSSGTCTVSASFAPTSPGLKSATITVSSPIGGMAVVVLTGVATN